MAFEAGQFFIVQDCPVHCKTFEAPSSHPLNASDTPVITCFNNLKEVLLLTVEDHWSKLMMVIPSPLIGSRVDNLNLSEVAHGYLLVTMIGSCYSN